MAQALEKDLFTLTWNIENFSMCPQKKDECIKTPEFVVNALDKTTWYLALYPKGDDSSDGDGVTVYLHRSNKDEEPDEVSLEYDLTLLTSSIDSGKLFANSRPMTITKNSGHGYKKIATTEELSENKSDLTPNDVLSLFCCMRRGTQPTLSDSDPERISSFPVGKKYSMEEVLTLISDVNNSKKDCVEHCVLNTRIPVERRLITWVIKDFKAQTQSGKKVHASVFSNFREKSEFLLSCYLSNQCDKHRSVRIEIERKDKNFKQMLMRCEVCVLCKSNSHLKSKRAEHLFGENFEVWPFPAPAKLRTIEKPKFDCLNGDTLRLRFEFLVSYKGEEVTTGLNFRKNNSISPNGLRQDIKGLLDDKEFTDVTLHAEGFELPVHKSLICARSPVFRKMFSNDTEEKQTGVVRITDIDLDTLKNMRDFMYEDCLPDLELEDIKRLYSAADKYEILSLKKLCAASLKFNLSASNVCDVLVLADLHQDPHLLKGVHSFLFSHLEDVSTSGVWRNLMNTDFKLAKETMKTLLTWKVDS